MKMSKKDTKLISFLGIVAISYFMYTFYEKTNKDKQELVDLKNSLNGEIQSIHDMSQTFDMLKKNVVEGEEYIKSKASKYYQQLTQDKILYLLDSFKHQAEVEMPRVNFGKEVYSFPDKEGRLTAYSPNNQEEASNETQSKYKFDKFEVISANLKLTTPYENLMKLIELISNNERKIIINKMTIYGSKVDFRGIKAFENLNNATLEELFRYSNQSVGNNIDCDLELLFYNIPRVEEKEEEEEWVISKPKDNPFDYYDIFSESEIEKHYQFANKTYNIKVSDPTIFVESTVENRGNVEVLSLKYKFEQNSQASSIELDLESENITISKKVDSIGVYLNANIKNKEDIYIVLKDSNAKSHYLKISESMVNEMWAPMGSKITKDISFPIQVTGLMIMHEGTITEALEEKITFENIFTRNS